jgi:hypothetical protein
MASEERETDDKIKPTGEGLSIGKSLSLPVILPGDP